MSKSHIFQIIAIFFVISFLSLRCGDSYSPKPKGYPRMDFPEKEYVQSADSFPYLFDLPVYAIIEKDDDPNAEPYWINVQYPALNASLHVSYKELDNDLAQYTEDAYKMVYKHSSKADNIVPKEWLNPEENVYGILYQIRGDAASTLQFYLTDSIRHYVRASFYFNTEPNKDSLAPAQAFIRKDIDRMIESFRWNDDLNDSDILK